MSDFKCPSCGIVNIDCGKDGYKTEKEIKLEKENEDIKAKKDKYYLQTLEDEKTISDLITENEELKDHLSYEREMNTKIAQESVDVNGKLQQKLEKIKEYVKRMLKCTSGHTQTYYDILEIIEEEQCTIKYLTTMAIKAKE